MLAPMNHPCAPQPAPELENPLFASTGRLLRSASWIAIPLLLLFAWSLRSPVGEDDFHIFRQAGIDLASTGNPYHSTPAPETARSLPMTAAAETKVFLYPPLAAHLFRPFAFFPPQQAQDLWFVLNVALLIVVFLTAWRGLAPSSWQPWVLPAFVLYFLSPPVLLTFNLCQVSLLLAALILPAWHLSSRFPAGAGLLLAVAAHIKLFPALLGFAFIRTAPRVIGWAVFFVVLLAAFVTMAGGAGQWSAFLQTTLSSSFYPVTGEFNISLNGFFRRLFVENPHTQALADAPLAAAILTAVSALVVFGACLRLTLKASPACPADTVREADRRHPCGAVQTNPLVFSAWIIGMLLISPLNGFYNHTLLVFPFLAILARLSGTDPEPGTRRRRFFQLCFVTLLACWWPPGWAEKVISLNIWLRQGWHILLLAPAFYGLVLFLRVVYTISLNIHKQPESR